MEHRREKIKTKKTPKVNNKTPSNAELGRAASQKSLYIVCGTSYLDRTFFSFPSALLCSRFLVFTTSFYQEEKTFRCGLLAIPLILLQVGLSHSCTWAGFSSTTTAGEISNMLRNNSVKFFFFNTPHTCVSSVNLFREDLRLQKNWNLWTDPLLCSVIEAGTQPACVSILFSFLLPAS